MSDISMHGYAEGRWRTKGGMDTLSTDVFTYRSVSRSSFFRFGYAILERMGTTLGKKQKTAEEVQENKFR